MLERPLVMHDDACTWEIRHGDCLDRAFGLPSLSNRSIDVVITDPPYDEHTHRAGRRGATSYIERPSQRATFNRTRSLGFAPLSPRVMYASAMEFARLARRWVLVFSSVELAAEWRRALAIAGLEYVRTMMWRKRGCTPQFTGDRPAAACEAIVVAHPPGRKRWNGRGRHGFFEHAIVLNRSGNTPRLHTAQKPLDLLLDLIDLFTEPGELVVDPFCGSGTTGVAALMRGRQFLGWDLRKPDVETAQARLATVTGGCA